MSNNPTINQHKAISLVEFIVLMATISSLGALSIDAMLPALAQMGQTLNAQPNQTPLIISMVFLGLAVGQLLFGPISDAIGRKFAILLGLFIFSLGSLLCLVSTSMTSMLVGRILQGVGVAGPRIASTALIRDQFEGDAMARVMSFIMMVFIFVPMIAPMLGQAILWVANWRAIFILFLLIALIVSIWFGLRQRETLTIDNRRAFNVNNIIEASRFVLTHQKVMSFTWIAGLVFGAFIAYLSNAQIIFQQIYAVGEYFSLYFAMLAVAIGAASFANAKLVIRMGMMRLTQLALIWLFVFASLLLVIIGLNGTLIELHLFIALMMLMFFCIGILFGNLNALAMQPLGAFAGLGAALVGFISNVIAVMVASLLNYLMKDSLLPIAIGFSVSSLLALLLFKFGVDHKVNASN